MMTCALPCAIHGWLGTTNVNQSFLPVSSAATVWVRALVMTTFCVVSPTTSGRHTKHSCNTLLTWAWNKYRDRFQLSKVNTGKRGDTARGSQHLHRYLFHCVTHKIPSLVQDTERDTHLSTTLTQILSFIHCTHINTFSYSLHPCGYLYSFTTPAWIPLFIHYTCMDTFFFFFFCCPINCADLRGTAPVPLVLASLTSSHTQGSFRIAAPPPEVHRKWRQIAGRLPSEGNTALLLSHFGGVQ